MRSRAEPVTGYGAVGVTWAPGREPAPGQLTVQARTRTGTTWSDWTDIPYDPEHAPDPDSAEGRHARPGTDALLVGDVDAVQVRTVLPTARIVPVDMRLSVISPGAPAATVRQTPALDTGDTAAASGAGARRATAARGAVPVTPRPKIFSRAQWGANERIREKSALHYFEIHAGFVHHTVNANDYRRKDVPAIIRSIYAYHVQSRGWSDIGYNFLVDRFGRIWEGRYGGIDRPVVGAHTLGYNDYAFAMSAIGNYETTEPSDRMIRAYGALFAWKLSLHGVDAGSAAQQVGPTVFKAINGHRDAAATACPGKYLYARLPEIRQLAAADQQSWAGRDRQDDLAGSPYPDLVVRQASNGRVFVLPTGGLLSFGTSIVSGAERGPSQVVLVSPDLTGDGYGDLVVRSASGTTRVRPGDGQGHFGGVVARTGTLADHDQISAVGDVTGDGRNDLVARSAEGKLRVFRGDGHGHLVEVAVAGDWADLTLIRGVGDVTGDGRPDLVVRDRSGAVALRPGAGNAQFGAARPLADDVARYGLVTGGGDLNGDGRNDLLVRSGSTGAGWVLPGDGHGGFGHALGPLPALRNVISLSAANVAGDSSLDAVGVRDGKLVVLPNAGTYDLGRRVRTNLVLPGATTLLNVGDWDRDGYGDLVVRTGAGALTLYRGEGDGRFGAGTQIATGFGKVALLAAVGDVTGDGRPDLMGQPAGEVMRIFPGDGDGGLAPSYPAYGAIKGNRQIGVGLWTGDGAPDSMVRAGGTVSLYRGNGPGGITGRAVRVATPQSGIDWMVGVSDVRMSGHPDVIVREKATGYLWLWSGRAKGFSAPRFLGEGMGRYDLVG